MPNALPNLIFQISNNLKNIATQENLALFQPSDIMPQDMPQNTPKTLFKAPPVDNYGSNEDISISRPEPLFKPQIQSKSITDGIIVRKDLEDLISKMFMTPNDTPPAYVPPEPPMETGAVIGGERPTIPIDIDNTPPMPKLGPDLVGPKGPKPKIVIQGVMGPEVWGGRDPEEEMAKNELDNAKKKQYKKWYDSLSQEDKSRLQHEEGVRRWEQMQEMQKKGYSSETPPTAKGGEIIELYRGAGQGNKAKEGYFYSPKKSFALNFTHSGQESELIKTNIKKSDILDVRDLDGFDALPYGASPKELDKAIEVAKEKDYKAIYVSEGKGQPESVYVIDRTALAPKLSPKEVAKGGEIWYHGTDKDFIDIDMNKSNTNPYANDFGKGLYLTGDKTTAGKYGKIIKEFRVEGKIFDGQRKLSEQEVRDIVDNIDTFKTTKEKALDHTLYGSTPTNLASLNFYAGVENVNNALKKMGYVGVSFSKENLGINKAVNIFDSKALSKLSPSAKGGEIRLTNQETIPNTSIFHETGNLRDFLGSGDASGLNVSTDKNLALGQGGKGIVIEWDGSKMLGDRGYLRPIKKPATDVVGQKEYSLLGGDYSRGLKSITVKPEVKLGKVEKAILNRDFDKIANEDGSATYTPKLSPKSGK